MIKRDKMKSNRLKYNKMRPSEINLEETVFTNDKLANYVLANNRQKRANSGFEEMKIGHLRRECVSESCSMREFFEIEQFSSFKLLSMAKKTEKFREFKLEKYSTLTGSFKEDFLEKYPEVATVFVPIGSSDEQFQQTPVTPNNPTIKISIKHTSSNLPSNDTMNQGSVLIIVGCVAIAATFIAVFSYFFFGKPKSKTLKNRDFLSMTEDRSPLHSVTPPNELGLGHIPIQNQEFDFKAFIENHKLRLKIQKYYVEWNNISMKQKLGSGNFGEVWLGIYNNSRKNINHQRVAVKTLINLRHDIDHNKQIEEFLEESMLMGGLDHPHVLSLIGVTTQEKHFPRIILPYMENGDLKAFLRKTHLNFNLQNLALFTENICSGMIYLHSKKIIHRDLAARNIFVDEKEMVKIGDFGLSRDLNKHDYAILRDDGMKNYYFAVDKERPLPVKWMAPECITHHKFTGKSDVWGFGVVMWEIFTRGQQPYPTVTIHNMMDFLVKGNRLHRCESMSEKLYSLMLFCWQYDPAYRPDFAGLELELKRVFQEDIYREE